MPFLNIPKIENEDSVINHILQLNATKLIIFLSQH